MYEPLTRRRRRQPRVRTTLWTALGCLALVAGVLGVVALAWPRVGLEGDRAALARISLPGYAGRLKSIAVRDAGNARIPIRISAGRVWPLRPLRAGDSLTVDLTVRRPGWVGWLVGRTERRSVTVRVPEPRIRAVSSEVRRGEQVAVTFSAPVTRVRLEVADRERTLRFTEARSRVVVGVVAHGLPQAGTVTVSAASRRWERMSAPATASWFPVRREPQVLVSPTLGRPLRPARSLRLAFSRPFAQVLGSKLPTVAPSVPGGWHALDARTLVFRPTGLGFPLGAHVHVILPRRVSLALSATARASSSFGWKVADGSTLRLQQLLAQAGYLPVAWAPVADPPRHGARVELAAALVPPAGTFSWRYPNTPRELRVLWHAGKPNDVTRAAVMTFEDTHGLDVDGFAGPKVWHALLQDTLAGRRRDAGYSYVYVHRMVPQSLTLWHNGHTVLSSPGNTGVPAAPTQLGSFPVFEHIPVGTMSGTNPDGTHYHDPGIRYISYFNHGDAIHAFNRASFGTPQSLGCVELPLAAAAKVWPYTPIGTLITVEN